MLLRKYQVDPLVAKDEFHRRDINNIHIVEKQKKKTKQKPQLIGLVFV